MRFISMLQAFSLMAPVLSGAQAVTTSDWPPASGSRVRILSPALGDKKQSGTVISTTPDTLFFRQSAQAPVRALSTSQIARMDIARGTHTRGKRGALIGFLLGAGAGAAIAAATYKPCECFAVDFGRGGDAAIGAVLGGVLGGVTGGIVGMRQADTWVPLNVPRAH
jgi:hypothetical protein